MSAYTPLFSTPSSNPPQFPTFTIRQAQIEEIGEISEVITRSFHSCEGLGILIYPFLKLGIYEDIRTRLCNQTKYYACFIATSSTGGITGAVELSLSSAEGWVPQEYQSTYISNLAVSPSYRRQGIAQRLLKNCEKMTKKWGFSEIYLHVLENNWQAQKLYKQCGYQVSRAETSITNWLFNQPRRLLLKKTLTPYHTA